MKKHQFKTLNLQKMNAIKGGGNTTTQTVTLGSIRIIKDLQAAATTEIEVSIENELEIHN